MESKAPMGRSSISNRMVQDAIAECTKAIEKVSPKRDKHFFGVEIRHRSGRDDIVFNPTISNGFVSGVDYLGNYIGVYVGVEVDRVRVVEQRPFWW